MQLRVQRVYNFTLYDEILDLYESEPIRINLQVEDFLKGQPVTDFTNAFRIPATEKNERIFKNLFEINGIDFDVTRSITAYLQYDDGSIFKKGQLRLLKIYYSENNKADYECVFLGLQRDFFTELGDTTLCQLNMADLAHEFNYTTIEQSWEAYPNSTDLNAGLLNGDILYPLIDFGDQYDEEGNLLDPSFNINFTDNFTVNPASFTRFKPMIRAKRIINKIFEHVQYTYESELFDDPIFLRLYISAFGNQALIENENSALNTWEVYSNNSVLFGNLAPQIINFTNGTSNITYNSNGSTVGIPRHWNFPYIMNDELIDYNNNNVVESIVLQSPYTFPNSVQLFAQEDLFDQFGQLVIPSGSRASGNLIPPPTISLSYDLPNDPKNVFRAPTAGDYKLTFNLKMLFNIEGDFYETLTWFQPGVGYQASYFIKVFKQSQSGGTAIYDDVYAYDFGFVDYQQVGPTQYLLTHNIELTEFLNPGETLLVSLDENFDFETPPVYWGENCWAVLIGGGNNNRIKIEREVVGGSVETTIQSSFDCEYKASDLINDLMKKFRLMLIPDKNVENKLKIIPWKDYYRTGTLKDWTEKLDISKDLTIEPLFIDKNERVEFSDKADGDFYNKLNVETFGESFGTLLFDSAIDIIKGVEKIESNFSPTISTQVRGYDGTDASNFIIPQIYNSEFKPTKPKTRLLFYNGKQPIDIEYKFESFGGFVFTYNEYPKVSNLSTSQPNFATFDINWQREAGYVQAPASTSLDGLSAYDVFWKDYIELIYSRESRKVVAYIYLTPNDIKDFEFNDVIFIKGVYYFVEKIEGVEIDRAGSYKCTLIKLLNYDYNIQTSANVWNTTNINWDVIQDNWND